MGLFPFHKSMQLFSCHSNQRQLILMGNSFFHFYIQMIFCSNQMHSFTGKIAWTTIHNESFSHYKLWNLHFRLSQQPKLTTHFQENIQVLFAISCRCYGCTLFPMCQTASEMLFEVFPKWSPQHSYLNLDVRLI